MHTKLTDIYEIRPGQQITDMSAVQKTELLDAATSTKTGKKKGLIITFDLSSSYRLTNNRLYSMKGQVAGLPTWTVPYPKPILRNHDTSSDPLGRIFSVEWVSNDQEAMKFFDSTQDFMAFKRTLDSGNVQKIYKEMYKRNLLTNDRWPGMGKLVAKARISDNDAIEKFLDGRYLTFSAGSHTDKYCCGLCGSDWATGDVCDHLPGSIDDEGRPVVMFTGVFAGREASVVTTPGNDLSQLTNMEFGDCVELAAPVKDAARYSKSQVTFTDASVDIGDLMATQTIDLQKTIESLKSMDARDIARGLWNNTLTAEQNDAIAAKSHFETTWLIRVHDALHSEYDWSIRYGDDSKIPEAVFAFHGDLHDLSTSKGFRDSIVNGALDGFDKKGEASEEFKAMRSQDNMEPDAKVQALTSAELIQHLLSDTDALTALKTALTSDEEEVVEEAEDADVPDPGTQDDSEEADSLQHFDWYLLTLAFAHELGDLALSSEATDALDEKAFVGPDRTFPVADLDHLTAARHVLERARLTEDQKTEFESELAKRIDIFSISQQSAEDLQNDKLKSELTALKADYLQSLEVASNLQAEVDSLKEKLTALDTSEKIGQDNTNKAPSIEDIKPVEDESASSSQSIADSVKTLGAYEKKIVACFKKLRDEEGELAAIRFLHGKIARGHVPRTFDITPHIQENE